VKTPPKSHGVLCILKTTTSTGVTFDKFRMGRKSNLLIERVYAHLSKNGWRKSGLLADPDLTDTLLVVGFTFTLIVDVKYLEFESMLERYKGFVLERAICHFTGIFFFTGKKRVCFFCPCMQIIFP
jgi:hypothetical protein